METEESVLPLSAAEAAAISSTATTRARENIEAVIRETATNGDFEVDFFNRSVAEYRLLRDCMKAELEGRGFVVTHVHTHPSSPPKFTVSWNV